MTPATLTILVPAVTGLLVALLTSIGAWFLIRPQRRKTSAEAADVITEAALKIVGKLQVQVDVLQEEVDELKCEVELQTVRIRTVGKLNAKLLRGSTLLTNQVLELGEEPVWRIACDVAGDHELAQELMRLEAVLD